jgi:hypothetical protein
MLLTLRLVIRPVRIRLTLRGAYSQEIGSKSQDVIAAFLASYLAPRKTRMLDPVHTRVQRTSAVLRIPLGRPMPPQVDEGAPASPD